MVAMTAPMPATIRSVAPLCAAAALLLMLSACGGDAGDGNASAADNATGASPTIAISEDVVTTDEAAPGEMTAIDAATGRDVDMPYAPFAVAAAAPRPAKDSDKAEDRAPDADPDAAPAPRLPGPPAAPAAPAEDALPTVGDR